MLQIEVTKISVSKGSDSVPGLMPVFNLTCWPEGVTKQYPVRSSDGTIDMKNAVIFQDFSKYVKFHVENMTKEELLTRAAKEVKKEMQTLINKYNAEQELLTSTRLEQARSWIESNLEG